MKTTVYEAPRPADTLVLSYYPVGGNDANTGARYAEEARLTGCDIAGITRTGSDTLRFSPGLRRRLSPENFNELCAEEAAALNPMTKNYDLVIVRGQSTGSFPALGVVRSGEMPGATHLLLEDGVNTHMSRSGRPKGPVSSRLDWLLYNSDEARHMPSPPDSYILPESEADKLTGLERLRALAVSAGKACVEQAHWAPIWRSRYSRDTLVEVATNRPELPIYIKFLGHTATSKPDEIQTLRSQLAEARDPLATDTAAIVTDFNKAAWHAYLLYPQFGAENIRRTQAMTSYVD